jgi:integrase
MAKVKSKKYTGVYLNHLDDKDITYYITYKDENKKLKWLKIGKKSQGINENYCNQKRNEIVSKLRLGEDPLAHKKRKNIHTLNSVAQLYFDSFKGTKGSFTDIKSKYGKHLSYLGDKDILSITTLELEKLQSKLEKDGYSPKTNNTIISLFSAIYNLGIKRTLYSNINPASQVKQLKVDNVRERYLTLDEINELEEYIENHDNFLSHRELIKLFVKLSLTTGARLMGILSIKKKDIDLSHGSVNINDFKRGNTYKGFLTDTTKELLKERIKKLKTNDYIFTVDGKAFTDRQLQGRLKPIIDKLFNSGLDNDDRKNRAVIHTLRHTFASHLAINGTPIFTIQKLMNHADINQTLRYAKLAPDSGMESVKNLYN